MPKFVTFQGQKLEILAYSSDSGPCWIFSTRQWLDALEDAVLCTEGQFLIATLMEHAFLRLQEINPGHGLVLKTRLTPMCRRCSGSHFAGWWRWSQQSARQSSGGEPAMKSVLCIGGRRKFPACEGNVINFAIHHLKAQDQACSTITEYRSAKWNPHSTLLAGPSRRGEWGTVETQL